MKLQYNDSVYVGKSKEEGSDCGPDLVMAQKGGQILSIYVFYLYICSAIISCFLLVGW